MSPPKHPPTAKHAYDPAESNEPWENYQDFGHNHWHNSLIWGEDLENVSIIGPGLIWGKGLSRGGDEQPRAEDPGVGNKAIALKNCRNVLLRDFSILHGGHFGILATGVDNLTIDNLKIDTNRDGMDIDCCRNVRVSNCSVNSPGDDGICLKSSYALGYARATEMVTITNCLVSGNFEEGTLLDATYKPFAAELPKSATTAASSSAPRPTADSRTSPFPIASSMAAMGLRSKPWTARCSKTSPSPTSPCAISLTARFSCAWAPACAARPEIPVGKLRRVIISNIVCSNASGSVSSIISGIPGHEIEDLKLSNILIQHRGGGTAEDAARLLDEKAKRLSRALYVRRNAVAWIFHPPRAWPGDERHQDRMPERRCASRLRSG